MNLTKTTAKYTCIDIHIYKRFRSSFYWSNCGLYVEVYLHLTSCLFVNSWTAMQSNFRSLSLRMLPGLPNGIMISFSTNFIVPPALNIDGGIALATGHLEVCSTPRMMNLFPFLVVGTGPA